MTSTTSALLSKYRALGWSFDSFIDTQDSTYMVSSPRLKAIDPDLEFQFDFARAELEPASPALRDEPVAAKVEDLLLAAEAECAAGALYSDAIFDSLSVAADDVLRQLTLLIKKGVPESAIPREILVKEMVVSLAGPARVAATATPLGGVA